MNKYVILVLLSTTSCILQQETKTEYPTPKESIFCIEDAMTPEGSLYNDMIGTIKLVVYTHIRQFNRPLSSKELDNILDKYSNVFVDACMYRQYLSRKKQDD